MLSPETKSYPQFDEIIMCVWPWHSIEILLGNSQKDNTRTTTPAHTYEYTRTHTLV